MWGSGSLGHQLKWATHRKSGAQGRTGSCPLPTSPPYPLIDLFSEPFDHQGLDRISIITYMAY